MGMTTTINRLLALTIIIAFGVIILIESKPVFVEGSITQGSEYQATTTADANINGEITTGETTLKTLYGTLGSVVITGDNTGSISFFDATTSDSTARAVSATSSLHIATIAASAAEGTYVFDAEYTYGLLMVITGTAPTSTILYR